jgi:hypothetical protein
MPCMEKRLNIPRESLSKVYFELPEDSPLAAESLWAAKIADGEYRLDNSPFYVCGYSYRDVVSAIQKEEKLVVQGIFLRGGHSTYRVFLAVGVSINSPEFETYWQRLERLGCSYEGAGDRLFSIDVPSSADISTVYHILEEGEEAGVWEFEEGHCGHPIASRG